MTIVIAGGTGFLGASLAAHLQHRGHEVVILTRGSRSGRQPAQPATVPAGERRARPVSWSPDGSIGDWAAALEGADVVVNLAGESIASGRWSEARKRRIRDSRIAATRSLTRAIGSCASPPSLFVSGSAVGYYGACGDEVVSEAHPAGGDFLADVCVRWEHEAMAAASPRTRVVCLRTGLVLDRTGGALPAMLPPFRLGLGGRLGTGQQYVPWVHKQDWVDLVVFVTEGAANVVSGPINVCAPAPVTNAAFARTLGKVLRRPTAIPAPAFALRLLLGEMADGLLLSGQRAIPEAAERLGFRFSHTELGAALADVLGRKR